MPLSGIARASGKLACNRQERVSLPGTTAWSKEAGDRLSDE